MITKENTIDLPELIDFSKYSGHNLQALCYILTKETPKRRETTSDSVTCRSDVPEDYKNTYLGIANLNRGDKRGTFKIYLEEHYFFQPKIIFKKVGKGGVGFIPYQGRIEMDLVKVGK